MTAVELKELRALCEAATKGEWFADDHDSDGNAHVWGSDGDGICKTNNPTDADANAAFIAAARTAVPALLDEVERLRAALATIERSGAPGGSILARRADGHACGWCRGMYTPCPIATAGGALGLYPSGEGSE